MESSLYHILETTGYIALGAAVATPAIVFNIKVAPALGMIDWPKARGLAEEQIPLIGPSLVLISLGILAVLTNIYDLSPWMLTTSLVLAVMGHFDDRKPVSSLDKMFFQMVCAATIVFLDPQIRASMGARYGISGYFLAFLFVVGLINAINFIDGIDGLAGLVILIGAAGLMLFSHGQSASYPYYLFSACLVGMFVPFLYFNIFKRRGFLGNVGSYFFSYVLASMHLSVPLHASTSFSRVALSALCFLVPMADATMVILSRTLTLRSPFHADKGHLHHRMVQTSIKLRYILICFGSIEVVGLAAAFLVNRTKGASESIIPQFLCVSYIIVTAGLILFVEKASKRRIQKFLMRIEDNQPIHYMKYELKAHDGGKIPLTLLHRLEARVSAEIRITDVCFTVAPDKLFVAISSSPEPLRGISARLDNLFQSEKVDGTVVCDHGEIMKISKSAKTTTKTAPLRRKAG